MKGELPLACATAQRVVLSVSTGRPGDIRSCNEPYVRVASRKRARARVCLINRQFPRIREREIDRIQEVRVRKSSRIRKIDAKRVLPLYMCVSVSTSNVTSSVFVPRMRNSFC